MCVCVYVHNCMLVDTQINVVYHCFQIINFSKGFVGGTVGGIMLVLAIHSMSMFFGCISFSLPSSYYSSPLDAWMRLKLVAHMVMLACQGVVVASSVALVEELVFRSWLFEEISADLGYQRGIILSGFAFSLFQRYVFHLPFMISFFLSILLLLITMTYLHFQTIKVKPLFIHCISGLHWPFLGCFFYLWV